MHFSIAMLFPRTPSWTLKCMVMLMSGTLMYLGIAMILEPLFKYQNYAYYYVKVFWPEFVGPLLSILLAISIWRLKIWTRLIIVWMNWFLAIAFPPLLFLGAESDDPPIWNSDATLWVNLTTSPAVHLYVLAAIALFVIHVLQVRRNDFSKGL